MEYKDLQSKKSGELEKMLAESRAQLFGLRMKTSVNQVRNVREIRTIKQGIAQMRTRLAQAIREEVK
ncbi:MAG: 50S ribosomal protein L29 [Patescibacteria group bacterium]|jgi:ribosomal protein L29